MNLPQDLLDLLVCALCKSDVRPDGETLVCQNRSCGLIYPVKEDIPVMLIDEASRPCPKCAASRDWKESEDALQCPRCGERFQYERK